LEPVIPCHRQYYPCTNYIIVIISRNPQQFLFLFSAGGGGGAISLTPLPVLLLLCLFHYSSAEVICSEMARGYGEVFKLRRSGHACNSERALIAPALRSVI